MLTNIRNGIAPAKPFFFENPLKRYAAAKSPQEIVTITLWSSQAAGTTSDTMLNNAVLPSSNDGSTSIIYAKAFNFTAFF